MKPEVNLTCPLPLGAPATVLLGHGGGGKLMNDLIERYILPAFDNPTLQTRHDGAVLPAPAGRLAFTTDSYVVHPHTFPGGDIGHLAVNGTVNDLAMCGARPLYLSAALILEEGLPLEVLARILNSMRQAARQSGVQIVTGDTKVVDRGKGDGIFITTAGIGLVDSRVPVSGIGPAAVQPGDAILVNGDLGRHGLAIMAIREGLEFETQIQSDTMELWTPVQALLAAGIEIHCLRDLTRGGLTSSLTEVAGHRRLPLLIDETAVPVADIIRGGCEILGLDPYYVANEGRFVAFVTGGDAERAVALLRQQPQGARAACIGRVQPADAAGGPGFVTVKTGLGTERILDTLSGEQLPRIC